MRAFTCPVCRSRVYFENSLCTACGATIGYDAGTNAFVAVGEDGASQASNHASSHASSHVYCVNHAHGGCNWTVPAEAAAPYCLACDLDDMIPAIDDPEQRRRWSEVELAKRMLLYSLLRLAIPIYPKRRDPTGLSFLILVNAEHGGFGEVTMGHANGVITIDATEADAHLREARRARLDEQYRTLLGHMRHESGHYFWERLFQIDGFAEEYRALFGDEREDYGEALKRYYADGAPADWPERFISAYATAHPWEDWAETFAHYLHILDGVETAWSFRPDFLAWGRDAPVPGAGGDLPAEAGTEVDPYAPGSFDRTLLEWGELSVMMNAMNRSLGHHDYYPFVITEPVAGKLRFIDRWMGRLASI